MENDKLINKTFGKLTIERLFNRLRKYEDYFKTDIMCTCICSCGNKKDVTLHYVKYSKNPSCGCGRIGKENSKNRGKLNGRFTGYEEIFTHFWTPYKIRAKAKGLPFTMTMEYIWEMFLAQNKCCALSGVPIHFGPVRSHRDTTVSIDRIDNSKGYEIGNVQLVHKVINVMKNVLSDNEFIEWCRKVTNNDESCS